MRASRRACGTVRACDDRGAHDRTTSIATLELVRQPGCTATGRAPPGSAARRRRTRRRVEGRQWAPRASARRSALREQRPVSDADRGESARPRRAQWRGRRGADGHGRWRRRAARRAPPRARERRLRPDLPAVRADPGSYGPAAVVAVTVASAPTAGPCSTAAAAQAGSPRAPGPVCRRGKMTAAAPMARSGDAGWPRFGGGGAPGFGAAARQGSGERRGARVRGKRVRERGDGGGQCALRVDQLIGQRGPRRHAIAATAGAARRAVARWSSGSPARARSGALRSGRRFSIRSSSSSSASRPISLRG